MPAGSVNTKTTEDKIKDTENIQTNEYDRLWLWMMSNALSGIMDDAALLNEDDKKSLKPDPNAVLNKKPVSKFDPASLFSEEKDPVRKCKNLMYLLGVMEAKLALELGGEQMDEEQGLWATESNEQKREEKAAYLVRNGKSKAFRMYESFKTFCSNAVMIHKAQATASMFSGQDPVNADTTMEQLADRLNLYHSDRDAFFTKFKAKKDEKALNVFRKNYKALLDKERKKPKNQQDVRLLKDNPDDNDRIYSHMMNCCNEYLVNEYSAKGYNAVKNSLTGIEKEMLEKGKKLQRGGEPEQQHIRDWVRDKGQGTAQKKLISNINNNTQSLIASLTGEKSLKMRSGRGMTDVFPEAIFDPGEKWISGVIAKLDSTKSGTSLDRFLWHNKNSNKYTKMYKAIRAFEKAVHDRKSGEVLDRKEEMLKACYEYINGKEKRRTHEFGRDRFNIAMMLIERYDSKSNFDDICNHINRIRDIKDAADEEHMNSLNLNTVQDRFDINGTGEKRLYDNTCRNATYIGSDLKKQFALMENYFIPKPRYYPDMMLGVEREQFNKLKQYDKKYVRIPSGNGNPNDDPEAAGLSDKDFAAVAYAASLSPEAVQEYKDGFPSGGIGDKNRVYCFSSRYTSELMGNVVNDNVGKMMPVIQYGRKQADKALTEYENKKPQKLAGIIANAIDVITDRFRLKKEVDNELMADGEMAKRMYEMLLRDEELMQKAMAAGLTKEKLKCIQSINTACELYVRSKEAEKQMENAISSGKDKMTVEKKTELMTDMVAYMSVKDMMQKRITGLSDNLQYLEGSNRIQADKNKELDNAEKAFKAKKVKNDDDEAREKHYHKQKEIRAKYDGKLMILQKDHVKPSVMIDKLKETEAADRLRKEAGKIVRDKVNALMAGRQEQTLSAQEMKQIVSGFSAKLRQGGKMEDAQIDLNARPAVRNRK